MIKKRIVDIKHKTLDCSLFQHQKHSHVCTVMRAKGVCRVNCVPYFQFANEHKEAVGAVIEKYKDVIREHRVRHGMPQKDVDLVAYVVPSGQHLCVFCGKAFVQEIRLTKHTKSKHARATYERSKKI